MLERELVDKTILENLVRFVERSGLSDEILLDDPVRMFSFVDDFKRFVYDVALGSKHEVSWDIYTTLSDECDDVGVFDDECDRLFSEGSAVLAIERCFDVFLCSIMFGGCSVGDSLLHAVDVIDKHNAC